jgi:hypothetical protein
VHAAPAVSVRCAGGAAWRAVRVLLPAAAVASVAAWGLGHGGAQGGTWLLGVAITAVAVAGLAWLSTRPTTVALVWDGRTWSADGTAGRLDVMLDLGAWMLLRLRPADGQGRLPPAGGEPGRTRWIPCGSAEVGAPWHALRVAAYGRVPAAPAEVSDA